MNQMKFQELKMAIQEADAKVLDKIAITKRLATRANTEASNYIHVERLWGAGSDVAALAKDMYYFVTEALNEALKESQAAISAHIQLVAQWPTKHDVTSN